MPAIVAMPRLSLKRCLIGLALTLVLTTAFLWSGNRTPSAAASWCSGSLVHTHPLYLSSGERVGRLAIYYGNGYNCAMTIAEKWTGSTKAIKVTIQNEHGWYRSEMGYFYSYAGGATVTRVPASASECVKVYGYIHSPSGSSAASGNTGWVTGRCG